jgi:hypothetical protein
LIGHKAIAQVSFTACRPYRRRPHSGHAAIFLNLVVAIYLIIVGLMGLNAIYHWVQ